MAGKKETAPSKAFGDMDGSEKMKFIGKFALFIITFGFAFPTLFD